MIGKFETTKRIDIIDADKKVKKMLKDMVLYCKLNNIKIKADEFERLSILK